MTPWNPEGAIWRKAQDSQGSNECIEIAGQRAIRDSKCVGAFIVVDRNSFLSFISSVKRDQFKR